MPYMGEVRNYMLNAAFKGEKPPTTSEWAAAFTAGTAVTGWKSSSTKALEKTAHGLSTGNLVQLTSLAGGAGTPGLVNNRFYFVKVVDANHVELSQTSEFVVEEWLTSEVTEAVLTAFTEVSGGVYKRVKLTWPAAARGTTDDKTEISIPMNEGTVVDAIGVFSQEATGGTLGAIEKVGKETIGATKAYVGKQFKFDIETA